MSKINKAFTLVELIASLVIIAIIGLIAVPLVINLIDKVELKSKKQNIDSYGKAIEIALSEYRLDNGKKATNISDLNIKYSGAKVECEIAAVYSDLVFLSECTVGGEEIKDKSTSDGYYHYGDPIAISDAYNTKIIEAINLYKIENNSYPTSLDDLNINLVPANFSCESFTINEDGIYDISKCKIQNYLITSSTSKDGYYHLRNVDYLIGEEIKYKDIDFIVIEDSNLNAKTVTLIKKVPLTVDEVNLYGGVGTENNHVNMYVATRDTDSYYRKPYDKYGYGGVVYYGSETCGYNNGSWNYNGCKTDYNSSDVKYIVDAWSKDILGSGKDYKARILKQEEYDNNCEISMQYGISDSYEVKVPKYTWMSLYNYGIYTGYWMDTKYTGSTNHDMAMYLYYGGGWSGDYNTGYFAGFGGGAAVRPVIEINKSSLK